MNKVLEASSKVTQKQYSADEALRELKSAQNEYNDALIQSCIDDILKIVNEEGTITGRDLKIFLKDLVTNTYKVK
ncbi:hypothetical protein H6F38_14055 [Paenibacillus sp. EKM208P]|nr:hypothetical protein H6F38_14055 [Paenibacillus sp. EKM208P]